VCWCTSTTALPLPLQLVNEDTREICGRSDGGRFFFQTFLVAVYYIFKSRFWTAPLISSEHLTLRAYQIIEIYLFSYFI
jgi:hypothetical protein